MVLEELDHGAFTEQLPEPKYARLELKTPEPSESDANFVMSPLYFQVREAAYNYLQAFMDYSFPTGSTTPPKQLLVGLKIHFLRLRAGIPIEQLADAWGISMQSLNLIETGQIELPHIVKTAKPDIFFGIPDSFLFSPFPMTFVP
jgi:DNA-binding XRE family transcriptional regulator